MAATEANECNICCQPFTSTKRKPIKCKNHECNKICCLECFERGLLVSDSPIPRCMFCEESIQFSYIREHCTLTFCNKKFMNFNTHFAWTASKESKWKAFFIIIKRHRDYRYLLVNQS